MTNIEALKLARKVLTMLSSRQIATWYSPDPLNYPLGQTPKGYYAGWDDAEYEVKQALTAIDTALKSGEQPVFMVGAQSMPDIPLKAGGAVRVTEQPTSEPVGALTPKGEAIKKAVSEGYDEASFCQGWNAAIEATPNQVKVSVDELAEVLAKQAPTATHWTHYREAVKAILDEAIKQGARIAYD